MADVSLCLRVQSVPTGTFEKAHMGSPRVVDLFGSALNGRGLLHEGSNTFVGISPCESRLDMAYFHKSHNSTGRRCSQVLHFGRMVTDALLSFDGKLQTHRPGHGGKGGESRISPSRQSTIQGLALNAGSSGHFGDGRLLPPRYGAGQSAARSARRLPQAQLGDILRRIPGLFAVRGLWHAQCPSLSVGTTVPECSWIPRPSIEPAGAPRTLPSPASPQSPASSQYAAATIATKTSANPHLALSATASR
jgi:hypothetical protein